MMRVNKRLGRILLAATVLSPFAASAQAQWPQQPVRIVVPYAPGGSADNIARRMAQELTSSLGQSVIVDNRTGGMSTIGMMEGARARPDGYTLVVNDIGFVMLPHVKKSLPYDPWQDLIPIGAFVFSPIGLAVNASSPYKTLGDLMDRARAKPGTVSFGSGGYGTSPHLASEEFALQAGVQLFHVPYKGGGEAMVALMSGTIDMQVSVLSTFKGAVDGGKLRMLAISGEQRQKMLPDVPTFAQAGLKGYDLYNWIGLWAPAGTPAPVVERLRTAVYDAMQQPGMKAYAESVSAEPRVVVGDDFLRMLKEEDAMWKRVIDKTGLEKQ
ncbi:tripartite tricarboxylate transporter substrate binding protein [Verticiella sediminum]|uniref:Tripartite tricarboxylate transporter substrate binding protein n=1 Tax=Verticiella sediminum TaxID=1247510 RepID=A0A556AY66_9BURK|nr:tripartite tricarboxylate transporter substrate binding protein [Verticiella sediminum]TSH97893.1 tripartite tricarboxylate transporter substrate binding protein [Verticiella sediminum]